MNENALKPNRRPLTGGQLALVFVWLSSWSWLVLWWWSANQGAGGWFDDLIGPIALMGWLIGAGFVGVVAGIARYILSSPTARYGALIGVPALAIFSVLVSLD
jgi:predicted dehydrogenase